MKAKLLFPLGSDISGKDKGARTEACEGSGGRGLQGSNRQAGSASRGRRLLCPSPPIPFLSVAAGHSTAPCLGQGPLFTLRLGCELHLLLPGAMYFSGPSKVHHWPWAAHRAPVALIGFLRSACSFISLFHPNTSPAGTASCLSLGVERHFPPSFQPVSVSLLHPGSRLGVNSWIWMLKKHLCLCTQQHLPLSII